MSQGSSHLGLECLRGASAESLSLEHFDQGGSVQAEEASRLVLVPAGSLERLTNESVLERLDRGAKLEPAIGEVGRVALLSLETADARGEIARLDDLRRTEND